MLVNTDDRGRREVDCRALVEEAEPSIGIAKLAERMVLAEMLPDGGYRERPARLVLKPLEVKILRATARPIRVVSFAPCAPKQRPAEHHALWRPDARVQIENVYPELDGGRFPVKRVVGDTVEVWADIFRDGHDKIAAVLNYAFGDEEWREAPFAFHDNDRWVARFHPDRVGVWRYTIEAWTDRFESWCEDLTKKRDAGQQIDVELTEGRILVEQAVQEAGPEDAAAIKAVLAAFDKGDAARRTELMLGAGLREAMARADDRRDRVVYHRELQVTVDRPEAQFAAWYEMFPRSQGKDPAKSASFDDCIARLDEIAALGFDVVYLVPIHPIGRINRKGRDNSTTAEPGEPGSPYAIGASEGGHTAVHPELGTLDDFRRFVKAAAVLGMEVALDFAIQCAPDHPWVREHRNWFQLRPDGTIKFAENPPKKYEDIVNVDFSNPDRHALWNELRDTVLFWIDQGVRTFRVDNPHTKPVPFWEWLIGEVKARCPETVFLSEAFTRPKMMRMLAKAGLQPVLHLLHLAQHQRRTDRIPERTGAG